MAKKNSWKGRIFLTLFALPFAGIGAFATWLIVGSVIDWTNMRGWVEVPCIIHSAHLDRHRGNDSTSYRARARYTYEYGGRRFEAQRVAIYQSSDSVGSFQQDVVRELSQYQSSGRPFRCFVNPRQPTDAVLYRELRFGLLAFMSIFAIVFGGFGFGLLFWIFFSRKIERQEDQLRAAHAEQPWMWNKQWADGEIVSSNKTVMIASLVFAAFWNLVSSPLIFLLPNEVRGGNHLALIGLLFPLVGLGLLAWAVRNVLVWFKYGNSTFQMAAVPGVVGGQLAGMIRTNIKVRPEDGFRLTLSCVEKVSSGSGRNRNTRETIVWQDERLLHRELADQDPTQTIIPVQFHIPFDARESTVGDERDKISWRLKTEAAVAGVDYISEFRVPVFRTAHSSPDARPDRDALAEYERQLDPIDVLRAAGIRSEPTAGGRRFVFPMALKIGPAVSMTLFLAVWMGAIWLMLHLGAPMLFPIVFGLFALLLVWGVLDLWLWSSRVEIARGRLDATCGMAGVARTESFDQEEIIAIEPKTGMQAGNRLYYMLQLATRDGKKHTIAKRLASQSEAQQVAEILMEELARP